MDTAVVDEDCQQHPDYQLCVPTETQRLVSYCAIWHIVGRRFLLRTSLKVAFQETKYVNPVLFVHIQQCQQQMIARQVQKQGTHDWQIMRLVTIA